MRGEGVKISVGAAEKGGLVGIAAVFCGLPPKEWED